MPADRRANRDWRSALSPIGLKAWITSQTMSFSAWTAQRSPHRGPTGSGHDDQRVPHPDRTVLATPTTRSSVCPSAAVNRRALTGPAIAPSYPGHRPGRCRPYRCQPSPVANPGMLHDRHKPANVCGQRTDDWLSPEPNRSPGAQGIRRPPCAAGVGAAPAGDVAAGSAGAERLGAKLALELHETPHLGAVGTDIRHGYAARYWQLPFGRWPARRRAVPRSGRGGCDRWRGSMPDFRSVGPVELAATTFSNADFRAAIPTLGYLAGRVCQRVLECR
jgi:hypothetical protein